MLRKVTIGVIVETAGRYNSAALRYALLRLNTAQTFAEFEIVYDLPRDCEFLQNASVGRTFPRKSIKKEAGAFQRKLEEIIKTPSNLARTHTLCDRYVAICNLKLEDNHYLISTDTRLRILAVGGWSNRLAPPSLLEFIIFNCLKQAVRAAFNIHTKSHLSARGCLFDFNEALENARNGILIGHICSECEASLSAGGDDRWTEIRQLIGGRWLGDPSDPFSAYNELNRLGYRAFQASGVEDTWFQKLINSIQGKAAEEITRYALLFIVLFLALKLGLEDLAKVL